MALTNSNLIIIKLFLKLIILLILLILQKNFFKLSSQIISNNCEFSPKYSKKGEDISPPFFWNGQPFGTKSFALLIEDQEQPEGVFTFWAVKNIPGNLTKIEEGTNPGEEVINSWGEKKYKGPKKVGLNGYRKIVFKLYALSEKNIETNNLRILREELEIRNIGMAKLTAYFYGKGKIDK